MRRNSVTLGRVSRKLRISGCGALGHFVTIKWNRHFGASIGIDCARHDAVSPPVGPGDGKATR